MDFLSDAFCLVAFLVCGLALCLLGYRFFDKLLGAVAGIFSMIFASEVLEAQREHMRERDMILCVLAIGIVVSLLGTCVRKIGLMIAAGELGWLLSTPLYHFIFPILQSSPVHIGPELLQLIIRIVLVLICIYLVSRFELLLVMVICSVMGGYLTVAAVDHLLDDVILKNNECLWPSTFFDIKAGASDCGFSFGMWLVLALLGVFVQRMSHRRQVTQSHGAEMQRIVVLPRVNTF